MIDISTYLQPRSGISENLDNYHLLEVNGLCPLCGKFLLYKKSSKKKASISKLYQIAHIFPNSPTHEEIIELKDVERLGNTSEDFENKIALCQPCHWNYDNNKTREEYLNLLELKKNLLKVRQTIISISHQEIEGGIELITSDFKSVQPQQLKKLEYKALKVNAKLEDEYLLLRNKIEVYVIFYFNFIKEKFQQLNDIGKVNFNIVASQVKTSFLQCNNNVTDKSEIFNSLVEWINSKNYKYNKESCEAIISFFVQNCEVFDEITQ